MVEQLLNFAFSDDVYGFEVSNQKMKQKSGNTKQIQFQKDNGTIETQMQELHTQLMLPEAKLKVGAEFW